MPGNQVELEITNEHGLHARPAALFVQTAARFQSAISLRNLSRPGSRIVNAKSIMDVLTAGVDSGSRIELTADGEDAGEALDALTSLISSGL
jgi:phosphotransferase system HPr (HPr) family protein